MLCHDVGAMGDGECKGSMLVIVDGRPVEGGTAKAGRCHGSTLLTACTVVVVIVVMSPCAVPCCCLLCCCC